MQTVYWFSQRLADVASGSAWLSADERVKEASFRFPKRRADWRLGRWTAKHALSRLHTGRAAPACGEGLALAEVRPTPSGAPEAFWDGERLAWSLSISHSADRAIVAVAKAATALGCDIEQVEPRSAAFIDDYFTSFERRAFTAARSHEVLSTLYWSAKESVLKALGEGLRLPLVGLTVESADAAVAGTGWGTFRVLEERERRRFFGFWRREHGSILTIASARASGAPVALS